MVGVYAGVANRTEQRSPLNSVDAGMRWCDEQANAS